MELRSALHGVSSRKRLIAGLSAAVLLATLVSANALAKSNKPFEVTVVPSQVAAGQVVTIKITDDPASNQSLGSAELGLAAGFSFVQGSGYPTSSISGSTVGFVDATTTPSTSTPTLLVQNLNLSPGQTATVAIAGLNGCGSFQWNVSAQQANQWNGGGNSNYLTLSGPVPTSTVLTTCHLAFVAQPADAGAGKTITSQPLNPGGTPAITVQLQDENGNPVTGVSLAVKLSLNTIQLDASTSAASLSGTGPVTTSSTTGNAMFSPSVAPTLNNGYTSGGGTFTLGASASGVAPATSSQFRIWGNTSACTTSGCSLSFGNQAGEQFSVASGSTTGGLGGSLDIIPSLDCSAQQDGGVPALPGTSAAVMTAAASNATTNKTTKLFIPDSILQADVSTNNATTNQLNALLETHYMVCMSAPHEFAVAWTPYASGQAVQDLDMTAAMSDGSTWYRGLLPDCQDVSGAAPCVQSRAHGTVNGVSGLTVTVLSAANDPMLH